MISQVTAIAALITAYSTRALFLSLAVPRGGNGSTEAASSSADVSPGAGEASLPQSRSAGTIQERWIDKFEQPSLRALSAIKQRAEGGTMAGRPSYVYVTYIESSR
jgi:hypothetical protein